jgi:hypothetical protein
MPLTEEPTFHVQPQQAFADQEPGAAAQEQMDAANRQEGPSADEQRAEEARVAAQQREGRRLAHPHTRLTALQKTLATPTHDVSDRIGALHNVVTQLIGMIKEYTPPHEEEDHGEGIDRRERREPVEGSQEPFTGDAGFQP